MIIQLIKMSNERDNKRTYICKESEQEECSQRREWAAEKQGTLFCTGQESSSSVRYFSMFTGVGGFELGLERAGDFKCIGFSEIDKYSCQLLSQKFPDIKNYGDATKIVPGELPDFDMLSGGFPCQAFSIAGKREGFKDCRGTLFFDIARILEAKRPRLVFLENVKGLLNHDEGRTFATIISTIWELGYDVQWMVLNSKFFAVPQNRERVFIIGNLRGTPRPEILPFGQDGQITDEIKQPVSGKVSTDTKRGDKSNSHCKILQDGEDRLLPMIRPILTPDRENKRQNGRRFKEDGEPSFTLTGQDVHGVSDGMNIRRLTPMECERLQGFPDGWTEKGINEKGEVVKMSDTQRYKMCGNAVTVNVIQAIAERLK